MNPIPTQQGGAPFGPPCPDCTADFNAFTVNDRVVLPSSLAPGDYLLSWRWDCDTTPQVWQNCADITITTAAPPPAQAT